MQTTLLYEWYLNWFWLKRHFKMHTMEFGFGFGGGGGGFGFGGGEQTGESWAMFDTEHNSHQFVHHQNQNQNQTPLCAS